MVLLHILLMYQHQISVRMVIHSNNTAPLPCHPMLVRDNGSSSTWREASKIKVAREESRCVQLLMGRYTWWEVARQMKPRIGPRCSTQIRKRGNLYMTLALVSKVLSTIYKQPRSLVVCTRTRCFVSQLPIMKCRPDFLQTHCIFNPYDWLNKVLIGVWFWYQQNQCRILILHQIQQDEI